MSRAGTVELAASIIVFTVIIANLILVTGRYAARNRSIEVPETENPVDLIQAFTASHAYMDPNSGNMYYTISCEKNLALSNHHLRGFSHTLHFPILIFNDNQFSVSMVEIRGTL